MSEWDLEDVAILEAGSFKAPTGRNTFMRASRCTPVSLTVY